MIGEIRDKETAVWVLKVSKAGRGCFAGAVVLMVLSLLLSFSIISWAIIAFKFGYLRNHLPDDVGARGAGQRPAR